MTERFQTRNWSATDTGFLQGQSGEVNEIVVSGEVQTLNTGEHPELEEVHREAHAKTLILDLKVPNSPGPVGDIVEWRKINFTKTLKGLPMIHEVEIKGAVANTVRIKVHSLQG